VYILDAFQESDEVRVVCHEADDAQHKRQDGKKPIDDGETVCSGVVPMHNGEVEVARLKNVLRGVHNHTEYEDAEVEEAYPEMVEMVAEQGDLEPCEQPVDERNQKQYQREEGRPHKTETDMRRQAYRRPTGFLCLAGILPFNVRYRRLVPPPFARTRIYFLPDSVW